MKDEGGKVFQRQAEGIRVGGGRKRRWREKTGTDSGGL